MSKPKILIVEDESIIALEIKQTLEKLDFEVTNMATDYNSALNSLRINKPDIILMDIYLGEGKDGIEIAEKIQVTEDIPIIYLTSFCDEKTLNRALKTRPVSYLIKPFKRDELKSNIMLGLYKKKSIKKSNIAKTLDDLGFDYYYDKILDRLYYKDLHIKLGTKEKILFKILIKAEGNVVTFNELEYQIWPTNSVSSSTLRTLIYRLRSKLAFELIETIPNIGCRIITKE